MRWDREKKARAIYQFESNLRQVDAEWSLTVKLSQSSQPTACQGFSSGDALYNTLAPATNWRPFDKSHWEAAAWRSD